MKGTRNEHQALERIDREGEANESKVDYKTIHHWGVDLLYARVLHVRSGTSTAAEDLVDI